VLVVEVVGLEGGRLRGGTGGVTLHGAGALTLLAALAEIVPAAVGVDPRDLSVEGPPQIIARTTHLAVEATHDPHHVRQAVRAHEHDDEHCDEHHLADAEIEHQTAPTWAM
jgi:hypothetical protein